MKNRRRKSKISLDLPSDSSSGGSEFSARLPSDYSPPTLAVEGVEKFQLIQSLDVNLTIQLKVTEITRKQITLLAGQCLYEVLTEGVSLGDWMVLEFLYSYLLGPKTDVLFINNQKEIEIAYLLKIVLKSTTWLGLEGKVQLPQDVQDILRESRWVPNKRTFQSRKEMFRLSKFLRVRIVPVDDLLERSRGTIRYSSYCKGYGESSRMGRCQRTRPSAELDGEAVDLEKENLIKFSLLEIERLLRLVQLEIKYSSKRS